MKTYNIMLSKVFPATHSRKGEPTYFSQKVQAGQRPTAFPNKVPKLHTIRCVRTLLRWQHQVATQSDKAQAAGKAQVEKDKTTN